MPALRKEPEASTTRGQRTYKRTPVTTYYRSKNQAAQSPFQKKEPKKNHGKLLIGIVDIALLAALLIGLLYSLVLKPQPKLTASDLSYHTAQEYAVQATGDFGGLKNHNKITFDEPGVVTKLRSQFPEVQDVQIELPFFSQQPSVRLVISPPAFKLTTGSQSFVIDSQGVAVAKTDSLPSLKTLAIVTDQSGFEVVIGKQVLSSSAVSFINTVIAQSAHAKVPLESLTLPPLAQELDLKTADQPYMVKFYLGGDSGIQSGQFLAARQKFIQTHQTPAQYLDVRVPGKIFYK